MYRLLIIILNPNLTCYDEVSVSRKTLAAFWKKPALQLAVFVLYSEMPILEEIIRRTSYNDQEPAITTRSCTYISLSVISAAPNPPRESY